MIRQKMVILPKVNTCGGDIKKKWFVYYSVRDPRTGKMTRFKDYEGLFKIKDYKARIKAAEALADTLNTKLKNGWSPFDAQDGVIYADELLYKGIADMYTQRRESNKTFRYFASRFLDEKIKGKSEATLHSYRSKLRTFTTWLNERNLGNNDISSLTNADIIEFFRFIIDKRQRSGNTVKKYKQLVFAVFDFAIGEKALTENPVFKIPVCSRINDMASRAVQEFDILPFKERITADDPQLWMAIEFEFYCYVRPGNELRNLKVGDIDFGRGVIHINREFFKGRRENVKEIPDHFLLKLRNDYKLMFYDRSFYVFGKGGEPGPEKLSKNNLRMRFVKFRKALDMPFEYKLYSWKHTGGVLANEYGVPLRDISEQMGHTNLATTSTYIKRKGGGRIKSIQNNYPRL